MIFCPKKTISSFWDKLKDATNKMFGNYFLLPITTVFFTLLVYSLKLGHSRPLFVTFVFSIEIHRDDHSSTSKIKLLLLLLLTFFL